MTEIIADEPRTQYLAYPSLDALRSAHGALLKERRGGEGSSGDISSEFLASIDEFVQRGQGTGALLDGERDRKEAQSFLDYWATYLFRLGHEPPDPTLAEFDPTLAPQLDDKQCPYLGLDAFDERHWTFFFGRQPLVQEMIERLQSRRFLAMVGSSGSGKSSLVLGGIVPALKRGLLPGSQNWRYLPPIVPGPDPLASLARLTRPADVPLAEWLGAESERLLQDPAHLARAISAADAEPAVLVVDQFEELFTLTSDDSVRRAFAQSLLSLSQTPAARHTVILTLRADFEEQIARVPALHEVFPAARSTVAPMGALDLREAIERPADLVGLKFEEGVVDDLVKEILGEPTGLPLLQFTLLKLWEIRDRNRVTRAAYRRLGGARLALARSADDLYGRLIPEEQVTARRILTRMVRPGEGLEITSNRVRRQTLYQAGEARDRVDRVLESLIAARLVRKTDGQTRADDQIEVAHEALVRNWPTLVEWLDEERVTMRRRLRLTAAAEHWAASGRNPDALWRGALLDEALRYAGLNDLEQEFVQTSQEVEERARRNREAAHQRELSQMHALAVADRERAERAERDAAHKQRLGAVGAFTASVMIVLAVLGWHQKLVADEQMVAATSNATQARAQESVAQEQGRLALARALAFQSRVILDDRLDLGLLLAVQARRLAPTVESRSALLAALSPHGPFSFNLLGGRAAITSAAASLDGQRLASGDKDGNLRIWDLSTGQPIGAPLHGHEGTITAIAWGRGGLLASGGTDGTIRTWNPSEGPSVGDALAGHQGRVNAVAWSRDGQLASGGSDGTVRVWDLTTHEGAILGGGRPQGAVYAVAWSRDGRLASGGSDGVVRVRAVPSGQVTTLGENTRPDLRIFSLAWNGQQLAAGSSDGAVRVWDVDTAQATTLHDNARPNQPVFSVAWGRDGRLASGDSDGAVHVWDVGKERLVGEPLRGHSGAVTSLAWRLDSQRLVSSSTMVPALAPSSTPLAGEDSRVDGTVRIWDLSERQPLGKAISGPTAGVDGLAWSPDGSKLASTGRDGTIRIWNQSDGELSAQLAGHRDLINSVAWNRQGTRLASGGVDGTIRVWDPASGEQQATLRQSFTAVYGVAWSPDGERLAAGGRDGHVRIWNPTSGESVRDIRGESEALSVAWSPDGKLLAAGYGDGVVRVWDPVRDGPNQQDLAGHVGRVYSVAWSGDGHRLASAGGDGTVRIWNVTTGQATSELRGHTGGVFSVAWRPDDAWLASSGFDGTVRIWDVATSQAIGEPLRGHTGRVWAVGWNPDGQELASAGCKGYEDCTAGEIWRWDMNEESWMTRACSLANRVLTPEEWQQYLPGQEPRSSCP